MNSYDFSTHISGVVRIDAESPEAAQEEFNEKIGGSEIFLNREQDHILVTSSIINEEPKLYIPEEDREIITEEEDG